MTDDTTNWSRDAQKRAALVWISFLTAGLMSIVCFAFIDPLVILEAVGLGELESPGIGYTIGFFFFWFGCALASAVSLRITRRKRQRPKPVGGEH